MIYCTLTGEEVPVEIVEVKNSSWVYCKYPNGTQELVHRKYIVADKGNAEIEEAMNKVTDNNVS